MHRLDSSSSRSKLIKCIFFFSAPHAYRIFNTWMGDPGKLILLERVLKVIKRDNLISLVNETGKVLKDGLMQLECSFPTIINSVRGRGTFLAYNACDTETRDKIHQKLKSNGKFNFIFKLNYVLCMLLRNIHYILYTL